MQPCFDYKSIRTFTNATRINGFTTSTICIRRPCGQPAKATAHDKYYQVSSRLAGASLAARSKQLLICPHPLHKTIRAQDHLDVALGSQSVRRVPSSWCSQKGNTSQRTKQKCNVADAYLKTFQVWRHGLKPKTKSQLKFACSLSGTSGLWHACFYQFTSAILSILLLHSDLPPLLLLRNRMQFVQDRNSAQEQVFTHFHRPPTLMRLRGVSVLQGFQFIQDLFLPTAVLLQKEVSWMQVLRGALVAETLPILLPCGWTMPTTISAIGGCSSGGQVVCA